MRANFRAGVSDIEYDRRVRLEQVVASHTLSREEQLLSREQSFEISIENKYALNKKNLIIMKSNLVFVERQPESPPQWRP